MTKKIIYIFIIGLFTAPLLAQAGILDNLGCVADGTCGLADIETAVNFLTNWLIGGIGAGALLYFIWGAVQWVTSYGNMEKVHHGRDIMIGSVTAIIIAFASFLIVQFFINDVLLGGGGSENFRIADECNGASQWDVCNEPRENFACSGPDLGDNSDVCMLKCQIHDLLDVANTWTCLDPQVIKTYTPEAQAAVKFQAGACALREQLCVNTNTLPDTTITPGDASPNIPIAGDGCCFVDIGNCSATTINEECPNGGTFSSDRCSDILLCDPGYVSAPEGGCCWDDPSCFAVSQHELCHGVLLPPPSGGLTCQDVCSF